MTPDDLSARARLAHDWLFEKCFPLWADAGTDPKGGFVEALDLSGAPISGADARVRVQARQTFVFAEAARLGWRPKTARDRVARGVEALRLWCRRKDGLFGQRVRIGDGLTDSRANLYDCAFVILAFASAAEALDDSQPLAFAQEALAALDERLAVASGGYRTGLEPDAPWLQNPHMHLLEALLALYAASGDQACLARADAIVELFQSRFIAPDSGQLMETFAPDWARLDTPHGARREPGHHFEWVWLLHRRARLSGGEAAEQVRRLYAFACKASQPMGSAVLAVDPAGRVIDGAIRTWPQTEALKAHLVMGEAGEPDAGARAARSFDFLFQRHLDPAPPGGWLDYFDANGRAVAQAMPASTGYHVVLALGELMRVAAATP